MGKELDTIRDIVFGEARKLGIGIRSIILFGSRARGDFRDDSDWDIIIVVGDETSREGIKKLQLQVYKKLAEAKIYSDVIVFKESCYRRYKKVAGTVAYSASREGKVIV